MNRFGGLIAAALLGGGVIGCSTTTGGGAEQSGGTGPAANGAGGTQAVATGGGPATPGQPVAGATGANGGAPGAAPPSPLPNGPAAPPVPGGPATGMTTTVGVPTAAQLAGEIRAGVAVNLPTTDGEWEIALAASGKVLAHGLATDDAALDKARRAINAKGLYGLASVQRGGALRRLPYADNMINLIVVDATALGAKAPTEAEILRVLAPRAVAYIKRDGKWSKTIKNRPADIDEWTHFDYDASGNAVSKDRRAALPTQIQWITGVQALKDPGPHFNGASGMRIASGRVFTDYFVENGAKDAPKDQPRYGAWDAWNGVPLWNMLSSYGGRRKATTVVAGGDRLYMYPQGGKPLTAYDGATGEVFKTYDAVAPAPSNAATGQLRFADGKLVVVNGAKLTVLDPDSGQPAWSFTDPSSGLLFFPTVDVSMNRAYVIVSRESARANIPYRWPSAPAASLVALDLKTGKEVWRNTEDLMGRRVGQIVPNGANIGLFGSTGIGSAEEGVADPFAGMIRAADGKLVWKIKYPYRGENYPQWVGYTMIARGGMLYYFDPWRIHTLDQATGMEIHSWGRDYNGRCMRATATETHFMHGLVSFVDKDWNAQVQSVTRSACANSVHPANGMIYYTHHTCGCITSLAGHVALTPEPLPPPAADAERLETGGLKAVTDPSGPPPPAGLLVEHWVRYYNAPPPETAPVETGGLSLVAVQHLHRLEARGAGGKLVWAFIADGRISAPPVVSDGLVYFGSRDGHVYALKLEDGSLAWRFLAAPSERLVVVHGQLESSWPVDGVVLHKGKVFASAGHHAEMGGGMFVVGLEPKTGQLANRRVLFKGPGKAMATGTTSGISPLSLRNVLGSDGTNLTFPASGLPSKVFAFDPFTATDEQLRTRLETKPKN